MRFKNFSIIGAGTMRLEITTLLLAKQFKITLFVKNDQIRVSTGNKILSMLIKFCRRAGLELDC